MVYLWDGQYDRVHFNVFIIKLKKNKITRGSYNLVFKQQERELQKHKSFYVV